VCCTNESLPLAGFALWLLDGRPGLRLGWRAEAPWLHDMVAGLAQRAQIPMPRTLSAFSRSPPRSPMSSW
jgi:hypothetical protein